MEPAVPLSLFAVSGVHRCVWLWVWVLCVGGGEAVVCECLSIQYVFPFLCVCMGRGGMRSILNAHLETPMQEEFTNHAEPCRHCAL